LDQAKHLSRSIESRSAIIACVTTWEIGIRLGTKSTGCALGSAYNTMNRSPQSVRLLANGGSQARTEPEEQQAFEVVGD
jgi:hypothetical protein